MQENFGRIEGEWLRKQANRTTVSCSSQALSGLLNLRELWRSFDQGKNVSVAVGEFERKMSDK